MITTLLVANRGEIACRIFRTCRELGIATVAVYSDADAGALHVREADTAVRLPGASPADTYLRGDLVVAAARAAGADAVHPGYGFLSENAGFAQQVQDAGIVWVGPPVKAIELMASKTRAKELMAAAGVPLLAPVDPAGATAADLPLLLKASAGGGGRGMRIVRDLGELPGELTAASAEAASAFGDGEVFAEPYVERGRHVEVQVMADAQGTVWALGTRDCSLQRRHQKVIEEAPAPGLDDGLRRRLHDAAVAAAQAVGYRGAGTVEFLVSAEGRPYFLEMNTRLQVEHPVTEAVFGLDLVALQLRVAEGAPLPAAAPPTPHGHAVEARLYAEDPAANWQPQTGTLHALDVPDGPGLRLDTGYTGGDTIGVHYDPMLAKAVAHAGTRAEAVRLLARTLERARIHGPVTNRDLLVRSLRHPDFAGARPDTGFYDRHLTALTRTEDEDGRRLAATAAALARAATRPATGPGRFGAWRNLASQPMTAGYRSEPDGTEYAIAYRTGRAGPHPETGERVVAAAPGHVTLEAGGVTRHFAVAVHDGRAYVDGAGGSYTFTVLPRFTDPAERTEPGSLLAPMPGTVVRLADGLAPGTAVEAGQPLIWLEAMKMEHRILAPASGTLTALHAAPGLQVEVGALLAVVSDTAAPDSTAPEENA
ncbi:MULTISPECIES: ATP-binding protein [Streptomyces]|uniref:Propionyl-CoA carboxylase alpha chain n=1 Tax=Streptomyces clavifer TaxID=68188 RepID=A0ABS4V799_9ACTN|nr:MULTISPECIES: biotin carboxylase N-terminal domain-containing protein [Streptomyces]KQX84022.1 acety-l/propionyl-CoA carboxylase subunit alpha [Streptomyces sp. Root1319]KQZ04431.1 acety-l/propionyl-CoA carboxylase subunit alpha [Streptomyces sp. Root55]MBP2359782.1 propionyl-CoA carboxylase alpha chain [Streptomyces clavifer]MDX2746668.1 biotin carboxylase N-terminal domain-containing protein [Streptomyces sp. NRRL_B-2557]MDX3062603.1 biotin carboxylase N-terminal domain-containing protein